MLFWTSVWSGNFDENRKNHEALQNLCTCYILQFTGRKKLLTLVKYTIIWDEKTRTIIVIYFVVADINFNLSKQFYRGKTSLSTVLRTNINKFSLYILPHQNPANNSGPPDSPAVRSIFTFVFTSIGGASFTRAPFIFAPVGTWRTFAVPFFFDSTMTLGYTIG